MLVSFPIMSVIYQAANLHSQGGCFNELLLQRNDFF